jgi:sulfur relay (sulfurtransferase) DsrC/TusE family protein
MSVAGDGQWTPRFAEETAARQGITLSPRHWRVITLTRELIARTGRAQSLGQISVAAGLAEAEINVLFRGAGASGLNEIAGAFDIERRDR